MSRRVSLFLDDPEYERGKFGPSSFMPDYDQGYEDGFRAGIISGVRRLDRMAIPFAAAVIFVAVVSFVLGLQVP